MTPAFEYLRAAALLRRRPWRGKLPVPLRALPAAFAVLLLYGVGPLDEGTELELGAGAGQHYDRTAAVNYPEAGCSGDVTPRARDLAAYAALRHQPPHSLHAVNARAVAALRQTRPFTVHLRGAPEVTRDDHYPGGPLRPALAVEGTWGLQGWFGGFDLGTGVALAPFETDGANAGGFELLLGGHINFGPHVYVFTALSPNSIAAFMPQWFPWAAAGLGVRTAPVRARVAAELDDSGPGLRAGFDLRPSSAWPLWLGPEVWFGSPPASAVSDDTQWSATLRLTLPLGAPPAAAANVVYGDDEYPYETLDEK